MNDLGMTDPTKANIFAQQAITDFQIRSSQELELQFLVMEWQQLPYQETWTIVERKKSRRHNDIRLPKGSQAETNRMPKGHLQERRVNRMATFMLYKPATPE